MSAKWRRGWSLLLTLAVLLGMLPMTAMATGEKTEVTQIETRISAEYVPYAGRDYTDLYTYIDNSIYGTPQSSGSDWVDDAGVTIDTKGDGDFGEWYDIRYQFEAGRTYTAEYTYMINPAYEETYKFTESTTVALTNPDPSKCTITGVVTDVRDSGRIVDVLYTMTIAGERSYPDIAAVTLQKITTPADGVVAETTALMYSNCTLTSQAWSPNVSTFAAGNTYTLTVNLHANDGYKFADDFAPVLGIEGYEKEADTVELLNDNKDAAVSFTYAVGDYTYVDTLQFVTNWPLSYFIPTRETSGQPMNFPFDPADGVPFENRNNALGYADNTYWYNETDGYEMNYTKTFEAGKVYSLSTVFDIKKDLLGEYRFADNATAVITGPEFYQSGYQVECVPDGTSIIVKFLFTGQFPDGEGSYTFPAMCYSYAEFKYAMESPDIRYVALGNVEDMLPAIPHDEEEDPDGITTTAIVVRGHKDLNLLGNAVFRCPLTGNYDLKYYIQLLTLTDAADSSLYIHGDGSLTYEGGTLYFVNSAITVDGGHLTVDGATVRGSNGYHTGYCYGINARRGSVTIQNGATIIGEVYGGDDGICAMAVGEEGETRSLSVSIFDGKFYVERDTGDGSVDHGITVWNDCGLRIYGMTSDGIELKRYAADTLDDYVMDGTAMTVNGVKTDPATCGTTSGYVEVYTEISEVDIHVNSPVAGESPAMYPEDVYMVPEGVTVEDPVWYENGQPWNISNGSERFEAGSTYQVELTLVADAGVKFINPLTSATINYQDAEVSAFNGNAEKGVTLTVDLGACSATVSEVAVEIDIPRKNATPDQFVTLMTGGYQQSVQYGIQWQKSSDGIAWTEMEENETYEVGNYHRVFINLKAADGYEFKLDYQLDPAVSATVNGGSAQVFRYPEENPDELIFVRYDFGPLGAIYIDQIRIEDVVAPVAGEAPSYTCTIGGEGYTINTAYSGGATINGIYWYDLTDDVAMTGNRTFELGHEYKVVIDVKTEDGYEFATTKLGNSYEPAGSAYVNGEEADFGISIGEWIYAEQNVQYIFTCGNQEISTVRLYNLEEPVGGNVPDTNVTPAYPEYYTVQSVTWTDIEGGAVGATFETDVPYQVEIVVEASAQAYFTADPTVYIDETQLSWRDVTVDGDTLTIVYTFSQGASAPDVALYAFLTQPQGGTLKAGESHNTAWETNFRPIQTEIQYWDGEIWDQWEVQYPQNALDDYDFESAEAASYRFRIVAWVDQTTTAISNEFTIAWEEVHVHSYSNLWTNDASGHWHECACGDTTDFAGHISSGPATEQQAEVCTVCGWEISPKLNHTHQFETGWTKNDTYHWHASTCGHDVTDGMAEHSYTDTADKDCNVCGHTRDVPPAVFNWSGDSCKVTLTDLEEGIIVMAASYEGGKMVKVVILDANAMSATLSGDNVKVFFLDEEDYSPIRKAMELQP